MIIWILIIVLLVWTLFFSRGVNYTKKGIASSLLSICYIISAAVYSETTFTIILNAIVGTLWMVIAAIEFYRTGWSQT